MGEGDSYTYIIRECSVFLAHLDISEGQPIFQVSHGKSLGLRGGQANHSIIVVHIWASSYV